MEYGDLSVRSTAVKVLVTSNQTEVNRHHNNAEFVKQRAAIWWRPSFLTHLP